MFHRLPAILLMALVVCHGGLASLAAGAEGPAPPPTLTTVAEIRALPGPAFNASPPLSLTGVVTLVDSTRNMLVLQDDTGAIALHPVPTGGAVQPGQRVSLNAAGSAPYIVSLPGYPFQPSGQDIRQEFAAPANEGIFRLTRMRGWLRPPVTGNYTFWISSDDSSELWLSPDRNPAAARRISFVPTSGWTDRGDWARYPSQRSESLFLKAGDSYYIEALHEQRLEQGHLAVAWEGPDLKQAVIDGRFVTPRQEKPDKSELSPLVPDLNAPQGVLREFWADSSVANLGMLKAIKTAEVGLTVQRMEITTLGEDFWPEPMPFDPAGPLPPEEICRWVEGEGDVQFLASDGASATLELAVRQNRVLLRVARWQGTLPPLRPGLRVKFRGVREGVRDANQHLVTAFISVPSEQQISFLEDPPAPPPAAPAKLREPVAAGPGGYFFTRGVVTFHDKVRDEERLFIQDARNGIFVSQAERKLLPKLQVGQAVQIGGELLQGKYGPGIRPASVTILGWHNLPAPAIPAQESPEAGYRDGQWTEFEGVARAVDDDRTVLVMGKQVPLAVWIGQSDQDDLKNLINATLRLRGVMSLELYGKPTLLVPSRNFVEVVDAAPEPAFEPVTDARLKAAPASSPWPRQVKTAGTVTWRNSRYFYLQDASGSVRVQPLAAPPTSVGASVEVIGFPGPGHAVPELTEATWQARPAGADAVPLLMDPQNPDPAHDGSLVKVEARLLSRKTNGADQILEMQADQQIFEAVLEQPEIALKPFAPGSVLALTGVGLLEFVPGSPDKTKPVLTRLLLRSATDVTLKHGPPWWTWQRTAATIGLLLTVLAGSLVRINYLKRRFARQQAARLAFARELLESQEGERRRIAASLHDSLGQHLLVIRSQAHRALQSAEDPTTTSERLEEITTTTLQAIEDVREITHNLRPYQLDRLGLSHAIRALARKVSETCAVVFACHVDEINGLLDKESEIHLYRIVQEGINNIIKHSGATEAAVVVKNNFRYLTISIRDNGRGLTSASGPDGGGFGLSGIRERARILGGTTRIDAPPGSGVSLQIELPLPSPCALP